MILILYTNIFIHTFITFHTPFPYVVLIRLFHFTHDQGHDQGHDHDQGNDQGHDHDQGRVRAWDRDPAT